MGVDKLFSHQVLSLLSLNMACTETGMSFNASVSVHLKPNLLKCWEMSSIMSLVIDVTTNDGSFFSASLTSCMKNPSSNESLQPLRVNE